MGTKLDVKGSLAKFQSMRNSGHSQIEVTPSKNNLKLALPKTPVSMLSKQTNLPPTKNHISQLANSRSIQNIASNITSEISLDSKAGATETQPESKKLKPSHSFTKCQKPNVLEVKKPNACGDSQQ